MTICLKLYTNKYEIIIITLGHHKNTFEKKVFKIIYNLQSFFETVNSNIVGFSK